MNFLMILVTAIGLAMDAFAVSICNGLQLKKVRIRHLLQFGCFFGGFQGLMTTLGFLIGNAFREKIRAADHWIAFGLLTIIGGKMLWDAYKEFKNDPDDEPSDTESVPPVVNDVIPLRVMLLLALATSIDAMAVGISFSVIHVNLLLAVVTISVVSFVLSALGVRLGHLLGKLFERWTQVLGGIVLIGIGTKILIEHLVNKI